MKFSLSLTTLVASVLLATNVEAFSQSSTWDYLLGASESVILASKANVVTIDLEQAERMVPALHNKGQKAICYFSGGTMQKSRKYDYDDYVKAGVQLPETSGWGNHYIDIRNKRKLQPLIKARMKRAKSYGCDGVEVDSLGLYIHNIRDYTKEDTIVFGKWLAETAHSVGIPIGLKNVAGCAEALEPYFDFAVVESCADSPNVCNYYTKFSKHGKAVFIVHYGDRGYKLSGSTLQRLIKETGNRNFICVLSDSQNLHHNSVNFNCNSGSVIGSSGSLPKPTTTKKTVKKTTTVKAKPTSKPVIPNIPNPVKPSKQVPVGNTSTKTTSNPSKNLMPGVKVPGAIVPGVSGIPGNQTVPGTKGLPNAPKNATQSGLSNVVSGNRNTKEVGSAVGNENNDKTEEGGSSVGTAVAIVAAGGVATAAVAGFIFLKKNKKFTSQNNDEYGFGY